MASMFDAQIPHQQFCPYEHAVAVKERGATYMRRKTCGKKVEHHGWCQDHQYCADLMEAGKKAGYPAFDVAYVDGHCCLSILAGQNHWLAYAVKHSLRHHDDVMRRLLEGVR